MLLNFMLCYVMCGFDKGVGEVDVKVVELQFDRWKIHSINCLFGKFDLWLCEVEHRTHNWTIVILMLGAA